MSAKFWFRDGSVERILNSLIGVLQNNLIFNTTESQIEQKISIISEFVQAGKLERVRK
jgi:hypothetical protein